MRTGSTGPDEVHVFTVLSPIMGKGRRNLGRALRPGAVSFLALIAGLAVAPRGAEAHGVPLRMGAGPGKPPRISLSVPRKVVSETPALARGKVRHFPRHGRVVLERRKGHRWQPLARGRVSSKAFRI